MTTEKWSAFPTATKLAATDYIPAVVGGVNKTIQAQYTPRLIDLGVVNAVNLLNGPQTLYTPAVRELVQLYVAAQDFVAMDHQAVDVAPADRVTPTAITNPLVQWSSIHADWFASARASSPNAFVYSIQPAASPIEAVLQTDTNTFSVLATSPAWLANHVYVANFLILGPDNHIWSSGAGGTSAGTIPNFAGNEGGTVVDNTITWTDEGAIPTVGTLHLYALVCRTG